MAEQQTELTSFFEDKEITKQSFREWNDRIYTSIHAYGHFDAIMDEYRETVDQGSGEPIRLAIALLLTGRFGEALDYFARSPDNKNRRYFGALAAAALGRFEQAIGDFEKAVSRGWDQFDADVQAAAVHVRAGDIPAARKVLSKYASAGKDRGDWHFLEGIIREHEGNHSGAIESYERAMALDPDDPRTMFRCAYLYDLHGDDEQAIELYERLALQPAAHINALINLSVLYEDMGDFHQAVACLQRVLASNPNHVRARLFLRDVESSRGMVIDEDMVLRSDGQNKMLDTPIGEFELSVRSRNCLKKMNINTLGDLLRISEAELLAYKNFGETSLNEIKALLSQKSLRLGQSLEEYEAATPPPPPTPPVHVPPGAEAALQKPVAELELSVRARKCLQRLNIASVGELITRSEPDLLAIRNFGVTSLNEIKERLGELGLQLAAAPPP